ncbi:translation initiation factor 2 subunit 3 [Angomonas deanei]|nr:translation initiation factor 2 subunit 3 [Angomonas deanei]|eukprot:EPY42336.1 translation initiation factor 2 subunit 3 [Angomonas deanei]
MHLTQLIVVQNKIDLVPQATAEDQYYRIKEYLYNQASHAPVIPLCAQLKHNIEYLLEYMVRVVPPKRNLTAHSLMTVIRSFDINKPSENIDDLCGGVVGGTVTKGILKVGQEVEIRPGHVRRLQKGEQKCQYLHSHVTSLKAEDNNLQFAIPGGLIAVGTTLDPTLTRSNKMVGNVLGAKGSLPEVYSVLEISYYLLLEVMVASKKVHKIKIQERDNLQLNVGSLTLGAEVTKMTEDPPMMRLRLAQPVCCSRDERVAISSNFGSDKSFRLVGWGTINRGAAPQTG